MWCKRVEAWSARAEAVLDSKAFKVAGAVVAAWVLYRSFKTVYDVIWKPVPVAR